MHAHNTLHQLRLNESTAVNHQVVRVLTKTMQLMQ